MDSAEYVRVVGKGDNKTYINVSMNELNDPEKETNFESYIKVDSFETQYILTYKTTCDIVKKMSAWKGGNVTC